MDKPGLRPDEVSLEWNVKWHKYVTETLGQKSIIVDADDLLADPGRPSVSFGPIYNSSTLNLHS